MKPTEWAEMLFKNAQMWTQTVVEQAAGPKDANIANIAAGMRDTAAGLQNMAVGLRATYNLLAEVKALLTQQKFAGKP